MTNQQPSIGRVVHYQSYGTPGGEYLPEPRAAVITSIPELLPEQPNSGPDGYVPAVHLCVLNPEGMFFNKFVPFSDEPKPGHWNWPPRVPSTGEPLRYLKTDPDIPAAPTAGPAFARDGGPVSRGITGGRVNDSRYTGAIPGGVAVNISAADYADLVGPQTVAAAERIRAAQRTPYAN